MLWNASIQVASKYVLPDCQISFVKGCGIFVFMYRTFSYEIVRLSYVLDCANVLVIFDQLIFFILTAPKPEDGHPNQ
jgi:hypothetical protein